MENENAYNKPVTLGNILKFAVPTIAMAVFMSFYTMVDGLFVSNLIGTTALSAINLTAPVIQVITAISTMLATGGSAVIMKRWGSKAKRGKGRFHVLDFSECGCWPGHDGAWVLSDGNYFWEHGAVPGGRRLLYLVSQPLSSLYNPNPADEQFCSVYDRL